MKIEKETVVEIALGVLLAGLVLIALHGLFGGWLAAQGKAIHGNDIDGNSFEGKE